MDCGDSAVAEIKVYQYANLLTAEVCSSLSGVLPIQSIYAFREFFPSIPATLSGVNTRFRQPCLPFSYPSEYEMLDVVNFDRSARGWVRCVSNKMEKRKVDWKFGRVWRVIRRQGTAPIPTVKNTFGLVELRSS
ncbi:unnamed protein product [Sphenostylis stenocarpa]|uniref:Uncharacterized protein n=1 Tax=Sphenostylis stenocarpa TaxID=92480 RepID=A0AA86S8K2_9FABA|nr:unnamed protein product [Sphenostylis stenocarpa]